MKKTIFPLLIVAFVCAALVYSCHDDEESYEPVSPVTVDLTKVPYAKLSEYHFFEGELKDQTPYQDVLPYKPISALFTDYAHKKRFVWMPKGVKATYQGDGEILELPVGAVLIKTFYYENVQPGNVTQNIETRLMIRKEDGWIFADYVWNDEQTEAFLDNNGSVRSISWEENGIIKSTNGYRIPSETECLTCHKSSELPTPIGIKPQNLNSNYTYASGTMNQLDRWINQGYLTDNLPSTISTVVDYADATKPLDLRVRSYVDINCAHCHTNSSHCDYRPIRFAFAESASNTNIGICVNTQDMSGFDPVLSQIVRPGIPDKSMLFHRISTTNPAERMPLIGRSMVHEEGQSLIKQWIESLEGCN